jgi:hypothetical protein
MTRLRWALVLPSLVALPAAALVAGAGCSSSGNGDSPSKEAGAGEAGVSTEGGGDSATSGDAASTVSLTGIVVTGTTTSGAQPDSGGADGSTDEAGVDGGADGGDGGLPGLPGVQICVYPKTGAIPCVMTDADGAFTLAGLPVRTNVAFTLDKAGYRRYLRPIGTASTDMDGRSRPIVMVPSSSPDPAIGVTVDWQNKGQVSVFAVAQPPDAGGAYIGDFGAQVALTPVSGNGPFFTDTHGNYVLSATSLVSSTARYFNLDPGTYTLTATDPNNDCEPILFPFAAYGFPVTSPKHSVQFPIVAGYSTYLVGFICTPISMLAQVDGG